MAMPKTFPHTHLLLQLKVHWLQNARICSEYIGAAAFVNAAVAAFIIDALHIPDAIASA